MKKYFIVSRYNEEIDWVENLPEKVLIYNKGDNFPYKYEKTDIPNIGRESETFVRSVIDIYNDLKNEDFMIFLQGQPFDHCPNLLEILNNENNYINQFIPLTKAFGKHGSGNFDFIFGKHPMIIERILDQKKSIIQVEMNNLGTNEKYSAVNEYMEYILSLIHI